MSRLKGHTHMSVLPDRLWVCPVHGVLTGPQHWDTTDCTETIGQYVLLAVLREAAPIDDPDDL